MGYERDTNGAEGDDFALFEEVAACLAEIPLGLAPIDTEVERLAREGKLKPADPRTRTKLSAYAEACAVSCGGSPEIENALRPGSLRELTLREVRQSILTAWWSARFSR